MKDFIVFVKLKKVGFKRQGKRLIDKLLKKALTRGLNISMKSVL